MKNKYGAVRLVYTIQGTSFEGVVGALRGPTMTPRFNRWEELRRRERDGHIPQRRQSLVGPSLAVRLKVGEKECPVLSS